MKNNGTNRGPLLGGALKALGLVGVLGMAGAIVLIAPLAGSGCNEGSGGSGGGGGHGVGGAIGSTGGSGGTADAGADSGVSATASHVTIQSFMYAPLNFTVAAGASVTVQNNDSVPHSLTSEAAMGNFALGAVNGVMFDTGIIPAGGTATFTIPANAPSGSMIPYFCKVHTSAMPQGMLTVQ